MKYLLIIILLGVLSCEEMPTSTRGIYNLYNTECFLNTEQIDCSASPFIPLFDQEIEVYKHKEEISHQKRYRYISTSLLENLYGREFLIYGYVDEQMYRETNLDSVMIPSCHGHFEYIYLKYKVQVYIGPRKALIRAKLTIDTSRVDNSCRNNRILNNVFIADYWFEKTAWYPDDLVITDEDKSWIYNQSTFVPLSLFEVSADFNVFEYYDW